MPKSSGTTDFEFSLLGLWSVDGIIIVFEESWPNKLRIYLNLIH
jgi:hypothetical protein